MEDEEDEDIHYTHKDSTDKSQDRVMDQSSEVVPSIKRQRKDSKRREDNEKGGDSPDFNRNTYDDLTISKTDLSHTDTSYRENILGDLTKRG